MKVGLLEIIEIVTIFQLLVFSIFLFTKRNNNLPGILLGIHLTSQALGIFGGVVNNSRFFFDNYIHLLYLGYPFTFLWGPTFYFYVKSFAFSDFKLKWNHLVHIIPFSIVVIYLAAAYYFHDAEAKKNLSASILISRYGILISEFVFLQILVYSLASLHVLKVYTKRIKENFSSINNINLAWLKFIIIFFIAAFSISFASFILSYYFVFYPYYSFLFVFLVYFIFFNTIFFKSWHQQEIFGGIEEKEKYKSSSLSKSEAEELIKKINNLMDSDKPYLTPGITIEQIADKINIPARTLSRIINEYFSQNFYDYINSLRIEEAKIILSESENKKTVSEILYQIGYNSKSSFNVAFKKSTGLTPTEYRRRYRKESAFL